MNKEKNEEENQLKILIVSRTVQIKLITRAN